MQFGYMRISKGEQTTALQEDALAKAAVERAYREGKKTELGGGSGRPFVYHIQLEGESWGERV